MLNRKEKLGDLMQGANTLDESMGRLNDFEDVFFSEQFLQSRPLLQALRADDGVVLLIMRLINQTMNLKPSCWRFYRTIKSRFQNWAPSRRKNHLWSF